MDWDGPSAAGDGRDGHDTPIECPCHGRDMGGGCDLRLCLSHSMGHRMLQTNQ